MAIDLALVVADFADAVQIVDSKSPQARNARSGKVFQAGLGPHSESETVRLVVTEMVLQSPDRYGKVVFGVPYMGAPRQKCDLAFGTPPDWEMMIEVKLLRLIGDNGKPNDNMLMHILSPYPTHRSALTDCTKLTADASPGRKVILIFGYEYEQWEMDPAIRAFEALATQRVELMSRNVASFANLIHPIHRSGKVFAWEIRARSVDASY